MAMKFLLSAILLSLGVFPNVSTAQSNDPGVNSYIESMRADVRADKVAIITNAMQFNDRDGKAFWPVYHKYEADLMKINDQRVALIKSYADNFTTLTDAEAKDMIEKSLDFESRRAEAKKKCAKELQKAGLSSLTVAKFIQLEHRLDLLVDVQIAAQLPSLLITPADQPASNQ